MASEKTFLHALGLFNNPSFRAERQANFPDTCPKYDARAAVFTAMDAEGEFYDNLGQPMGPSETDEFEMMSKAIIKMSEKAGE